MGQALYRLVYLSRNRVAGSAEDVARHIRDILATSRSNNPPVGITGALMFNAGCFAQVLEGPREMLETTFERIQLDDRHADVSVLAFEPAEARDFGNWSMGYFGTRSSEATAFADVAAASGFDPARATGDDVLARLRQLALEEEAYA